MNLYVRFQFQNILKFFINLLLINQLPVAKEESESCGNIWELQCIVK